MAYDGIITGIIAKDLNVRLKDSKIEKIFQPEPDTILMQLRTRGTGREKLLICISSQGSRVQMTKIEFENPETAPAFCMLLRKHIQGGRITGAYQFETERIICLDIETFNEMGYSVSKTLIAEVMGKHSNLILTDASTGKIIDSIKRVSIDESRARQVLPGMIYQRPPRQNKPDFWTLEDASGLEPMDIMGFSPSLANQLDIPLIDLKNRLLSGNIAPRVYIENNIPKDFHAIELPGYESTLETRAFSDIYDALDYYYSNRQETNKNLQRSADLNRTLNALIEKAITKKKKLLEEIQMADNADIYRIKGELLNANLHLVRPGEKSVEVTSYYDNSKVIVELDERLSPAKNAQNYYKKYSKLKSSKKEKLLQLDQCEDDIAYLESVQGLIPGAESAEELESIRSELTSQGYIRANKSSRRKKTHDKPKPRVFEIDGGYKVLVGRNNNENDYITLKLGQKTDWWFHTKGIHGSHVVLICEGRDPDEKTMHAAANIAAWYSKGQQSGQVPVDYAQLKYVKKPAGAKPGKVIFTNNGTIYADPHNPSEKK